MKNQKEKQKMDPELKARLDDLNHFQKLFEANQFRDRALRQGHVTQPASVVYKTSKKY